MRGVYRAQSHPAASQKRRFRQSPIDALIDIKVGGRLFCKIPIGLDVHPVIAVRVAVIPQRWPACRRDVRGLRVHPDVIEDLSYLRALGD